MKTIGITGIPGSGKTYFAKYLSLLLDDSIGSDALNNRNLITYLKKTAYLNIDTIRKQENIKSIFSEVFGNVTKYSDEHLGDISKRVEFVKKCVPIMQNEITKNIEEAKRKGMQYFVLEDFVLDGTDFECIDFASKLDYTFRIQPASMDKRNLFLKDRLDKDGSPNSQKQINSIDLVCEKMQYDKVPVHKTFKNRYDRSLLIEAKFASDYIKANRSFRRLEVYRPKKKLKSECSVCNLLYSPTYYFKNEHIIFRTKNFFAKPTMHCFGKGHIIICPKKCITHIAKLDNEQIKELKMLLNRVKKYCKYATGHLPLLWFHNETQLNFKNSTPHLHIHVIPQKCLLSEKNISEMQLGEIKSLENLQKLDENKSVFYICDSSNNEFLATDTYTMPFFRELLSELYNTTFFKFKSTSETNKNIDETISFYKGFNAMKISKSSYILQQL